MKPDSAFNPRLAAKKLLREGRSGALATLMPGCGDPYCSLVNVATAIDGAPLLLLSNLALHTKNIQADARVSLMLDERKEGDPLEGARIMLMGACAKTDRTVAGAYLRRHPEAEMFAGFGDFAFYRMAIARAHLVAGFGRIVDIKPEDLLADMSNAQALVESEIRRDRAHERRSRGCLPTVRNEITWRIRRRLALCRHRSRWSRIAARPNGFAIGIPAACHRPGSAARGSETTR